MEKAGASGKLMLDEQDEEVIVTAKTYWKLIKGAGGVPLIIFINVIMISFISSQILGSFYTQKWAYASPAEQQDRFSYYVTIIFVFTTLTSVLVFCRVTTLVCSFLHVAQKIHNKYLEIVFKAPINLFFDVTPIGKILNRFSKDLSTIDEDLCFCFGSFLACFWMAFGALVVASISVPWIMIIVGIVAFLAVWLFLYSMAAYRDSYRIEAVSWSPLLSYF